MHQVPRLGRKPRLVAAALAAGVTWGVLSGIVKLDSGDHARLVAAVAERQRATMVAEAPEDRVVPQIIAAAVAP